MNVNMYQEEQLARVKLNINMNSFYIYVEAHKQTHGTRRTYIPPHIVTHTLSWVKKV